MENWKELPSFVCVWLFNFVILIHKLDKEGKWFKNSSFMDLDGIMLSERKTQYDFTFMWNLKTKIN